MRRPGMTLVELLVALAVTAITAAGGVASLGALADHRERMRTDAAGTIRAAAVRDAIVTWLEGAHVTGEEQAPAFQLRDHAHRGQPDDELIVLTSAATPLGEGNVVVRLLVDRDPRTLERGLVAEFVERYGPRTARVELDPAVAALDIRCASDVVGGRREWLRSWSSAELVPHGVELRLGSASRDALHPLLRVPLTIAIQGGT